MSERWRLVKDYEGVYEVSDLGRVRRVAPSNGTQAGYVLQPTVQPSGYLAVGLSCRSLGRKYETRRVHCLVAEAFLGKRPRGAEVNHKNGRKGDNRACNLEYVSRKTNAEHAGKTGLLRRGSRHPHARLTERQVIEIVDRHKREQLDSGQLARIYGVKQTCIRDLLAGKTWSWLTGRKQGHCDPSWYTRG